MKTAIVTDTNSSMTFDEAERLGVYLLPMPIIIDGKEYYEGVDIGYEQFFEKLAAGADVSTSQPSPEAVMALWDKALEDHEYVIHIPMSSALSGSCQTATALAEDYGGKVIVIDNKRISISQRRSVLDALRLAKLGVPAQSIAAHLYKTYDENSIYLAVHTLALLKKSGRVTPAGAAVAAILGINPVLQIQGGKLDAYAKARGMKRAQQTMLKAIDDDLAKRFKGKKVCIDLAYSGDFTSAMEWKQLAEDHFPNFKISMYRLPLSICCHVAWGVKALGISLLYDD